MNPATPPRFATWLLQKLARGYCPEALEGDLIESWRSRGNAWYWRQVIAAVAINAWHTARVHGLTFALAVGSFWVTIWLSRLGTREVLSAGRGFHLELFELLGSTPLALTLAKSFLVAVERLWFALVFVAQGYLIGRLHRHFAKAAAVTALAAFIVWPNLDLLGFQLTQVLHGDAGLDTLAVSTFFVQNVVCVLIGATWVARRWPKQPMLRYF